VARDGCYDLIRDDVPSGAVAVPSVLPDEIARVVMRLIAEPAL
jgi:hypothetical protein